MAKDIHAKPFDESTKVKLELFRLYAREWLPVFIHSSAPRIEIYDYFAGEGQDVEGTWGSPLLILDELKNYCAELKQKRIRVDLHFNDFQKRKIDALRQNIKNKIIQCAADSSQPFCKVSATSYSCPFHLHYHNSDFQKLFLEDYLHFKQNPKTARLIFIDQYGIKQVTKEVFEKLTSLLKTDFMFFISSFHIVRFKDHPSFRAYIETENIEFTDQKPAACHRTIHQYYTKFTKSNYFLGQFSIKKGTNYYGLIFGSNNHLGMKKFLDVAWKIDPHTGDANHDIDGDKIRSGQLTIDFDGANTVNTVKKLVLFEEDLLNFLQEYRSNKSIYKFSLEKGIKIEKTNKILKKLENYGKLEFGGAMRRKGAFYLYMDADKEILIKAK